MAPEMIGKVRMLIKSIIKYYIIVDRQIMEKLKMNKKINKS